MKIFTTAWSRSSSKNLWLLMIWVVFSLTPKSFKNEVWNIINICYSNFEWVVEFKMGWSRLQSQSDLVDQFWCNFIVILELSTINFNTTMTCCVRKITTLGIMLTLSWVQNEWALYALISLGFEHLLNM